MSRQSALADAPAESPSSVAPVARKSLGWVSVGYFPKERQRHSDGQSFIAHDFGIRHSYKKDGKVEHVDITIPRNQALNLAECLRNVYSQSYEHAPQSDEGEE